MAGAWVCVCEKRGVDIKWDGCMPQVPCLVAWPLNSMGKHMSVVRLVANN